MKTTFLTLSAIGCLAAALPAQGPAKPALERALAAFREGDVDQDGKLSASEAQAIGIEPDVQKRFDDDADQSIARDEFVLYYHDLLVQAGQPSGTELESEVGRIQAIRRAREARRQQREREAAVETAQREGPADARAARARAELNAQGAPARSEPAEQAESDAGIALGAAFDRLHARILDSVATREDYEAIRAEVRRIEQAWIARARRAARQGDAQAQQEGVEQASAGTALLAALDDLERRASAGQVVDEAEFRELKNRLIARARQAVGQASGTDARSPDARAAAARAELAGRAADQDPLTTDEALRAALDRLEQRVLNGEAKRDDFQTLRERFIARARRGAAEAGATGPDDGTAAAPAPGSQRLVAALDDLEQKFLAGTVARSDFRALRELMIRNAREASSANASGPAAATGPSVRAQQAREQLAEERRADAGASSTSSGQPGPAAPRPAARLMLALDQLQQRALSGEATRDDYQRLRAILIQKARQAANGGAQTDGITVERARDLQSTLDELEVKAGSARLTAQDFDGLRGILAQAADEATPVPAPNAREVEAERGDATRIEPSRQVRPPEESASGAAATGRGAGEATGGATRGDTGGNTGRGAASNGTPPPPQQRQGSGRGGGR